MKKDFKDITKFDCFSFTCDHCGETFVLSEFQLRYHSCDELIPTLKYSLPTNHNDIMVEKHFCSKYCLIQLLKDVPFSFEVNSPIFNFTKEETTNV